MLVFCMSLFKTFFNNNSLIFQFTKAVVHDGLGKENKLELHHR